MIIIKGIIDIIVFVLFNDFLKEENYFQKDFYDGFYMLFP